MAKHFQGSRFVWKGFKKNPVLSIFGSPLLLADLALLPARLVYECAKRDKSPDYTQYRTCDDSDAAYLRDLYNGRHRFSYDYEDKDRGRKNDRNEPKPRRKSEPYSYRREQDPYYAGRRRRNRDYDEGPYTEYLSQSSDPSSLLSAKDVESWRDSVVEGQNGSRRRQNAANANAREDARPSTRARARSRDAEHAGYADGTQQRAAQRRSSQAHPAQPHNNPLRQADVQPALTSSRSGVCQRDFAPAQAQTALQQPAPETQSRSSTSRTSRTPTAQSGVTESSVTASSSKSSGTRGSKRSRYERADTVVPGDSASVAGLHSAQVPRSRSSGGSSRTSQATSKPSSSGSGSRSRPSRASGRPPTILEGAEPVGNHLPYTPNQSMPQGYQVPPAQVPGFNTADPQGTFPGQPNPVYPTNPQYPPQTSLPGATGGQYVPRSQASASSSGVTPNILKVNRPGGETQPAAGQNGNEEDAASDTSSPCQCSECVDSSDDEETVVSAAAGPSGGWAQPGMPQGNGYAPQQQQQQSQYMQPSQYHQQGAPVQDHGQGMQQPNVQAMPQNFQPDVQPQQFQPGMQQQNYTPGPQPATQQQFAQQPNPAQMQPQGPQQMYGQAPQGQSMSATIVAMIPEQTMCRMPAENGKRP